MALSYLGSITMTAADLANIFGVANTAAALGTYAASTPTTTTFPAPTAALLAKPESPFGDLKLEYSTNASSLITLQLALGNRTSANARRFANIVSEIAKMQSSALIPAGVIPNRIDTTP